VTPAPGALDSKIGASEFNARMDRLGPFESHPHMAVGVSGGADSMALAVLLSRWIKVRGGQLTALIVDHGLRAAAAAEARSVGRRLRSLGIANRVFHWDGDIPKSNVQAEGRRIRYNLMLAWCARHGVLHLALGHHREDQAETFLLRLGRGSGLDGLAAMAEVNVGGQIRLLRPFLDVPKARLIATLQASKVDWIEDPTNRDTRHARIRLRAMASQLAAEGLNAERLAATAARLSRARRALETYTAELLVRAVEIYPAGFARLDAARLCASPEEVALRALARILTTVGGLDYAPRLDRLERVLVQLRGGLEKGLTLGGCRVLSRAKPWPHVLVVREQRGAAETPLHPGQAVLWDNRFEIAIKARGRTGPAFVAPLGRAGWAALKPLLSGPAAEAVPGAARTMIPAIWDRSGLLAVPHLGYRRTGPGGQVIGPMVSKCLFTPKNGLTAGAFTVA